MPKRIAFFTTSYPRYPGDESSVFLKRLVEGYSSVGCSGLVIVPYDEKEPQREIQDSFEIIRYKYGLFSKGRLAFGSGIMPNLRANPLLILQVPLLLFMMFWSAFKRRNDFDVVHANWIVSAFAAWLLQVFTDKEYVVTVRGEDIRLLRNPVFRFLMTPVISSAKKVVSVSNSFRDELREIISLPEEKLICVPNGVFVLKVTDKEIDEFCNSKALSKDKKYLLFVGRVLRLKRVHLLLELLSDRDLSDYELIICGRVKSEAYMKELRQKAKQLGIEERVHFTGSVSPAEVSCLLELSRYYLSASETEGRSNSVLEAMYAGVPVILSNIPGHREVSEAGKAGFLFDVSDLKAIARFIAELDSDAARYHEYVSAAHQFIADITWENSARSYLAAFS